MTPKTLLLFLFLLGFQYSLMAEGDGYGENPGGAGGDTIVVDNKEDFKAYAGSSNPYVILIKDTIDVGSEVRVSSYKTISGIDSTSTIIGDVNISSGTNNVIVKNLNITNPANDGITIRNAQYVYVTNCTVYDCADGCIDVTVESDFVTISHCRFYYEKVTFHKFVNLIGASDDNISDRGKLHVTMHDNWWDKGCTSRMPRVRFGYVHVYNNYFSCTDNNYANRAGFDGHIFSEYNYFDGVRDPLTVEDGGVAKSIGNEYVNCSGTIYSGDDEVFTPSYNYITVSPGEAKEMIIKQAGNTNKYPLVTESKKETSIFWNDQATITYGTPLSETQLNATASGNTSAPVYSHPIGSILPEGYNTITVTFPEDSNYKAASKTVNIKVNYEYYSLAVFTTDGVSSKLVKISPEGTLVNGNLSYPKGTVVTLIASSNVLSSFDHWDDGDTASTKSITMNEDMEVTANYNQLDYIVGWDFYAAGNYNRKADYYSSDENLTSEFQLKDKSGVGTTWTSFSGTSELLGKNAAMIDRGIASLGSYYFQINFDATKFENIKVNASMLGLYTFYQTQKVEYSTDGISFEKVGEINLEQDSVWNTQTFQLPDDANGCDSVLVRFKADTSSKLTVSGKLGTSISDIYVLADVGNGTFVQVNKANSQIVAKEYYSIDGKRLSALVYGLNIVVLRFADGSTSVKKIFVKEF